MRSDAKPVTAIKSKAWAEGQVRPAQESKAGFYLVLLSLLFEFGRPQQLIPGVKLIPFATGLDVWLLLKVIMSGTLDLSRLQTKLWIPLFVVMAIHVPIATNNYWALITFKDMLLIFGLYLGIVTYVNSLEKMKILMKMWLGLLGFLAVMGIVSGGHGIGGWMGDENDFCMVMDMAAPFGYFLMFSATEVRQKLKYLAFLGTFVLAAMTTLSRGGFLGLASVGAYCWYRSPKKLNALLVVVTAVVFMLFLAPERYWDEIASSTSEQTLGEDGTGGARLYTWSIGIDMFLSNPIIGVGQKNFPWVFEYYQGERTFNTRSFSGREAHNAWITLAAELGLVGIFIVGGMLFGCYRDLKLIRSRFAPPDSSLKHGQVVRPGEDVRIYLARAMEGSLIGYIVSSIFISTLWYPSLWVMVAFVVALRNISEVEGGEKVSAAIQPRKLRRIPPPKCRPTSDFVS